MYETKGIYTYGVLDGYHFVNLIVLYFLFFLYKVTFVHRATNCAM
jgi:hypothetical protein